MDTHILFHATNLLQMRKNRLETYAVLETKAENNWLESNKELKNNTLEDIIEPKDLVKDLDILNNKYLQSILIKIIYK